MEIKENDEVEYAGKTWRVVEVTNDHIWLERYTEVTRVRRDAGVRRDAELAKLIRHVGNPKNPVTR